MIPLRLSVKNFMCYRDNVPTLDLEGIHVACLCGDNGHGKTALLDAITWALWGQARARTQEELIHQGRQDMAVELEFTARDQRYHVSRRYSRSVRGRQGATLLELQVSSNNGNRAITGNTVRETEARIRDILHLDYDTFVNTAFLLQGRADLFTRSSPAKRKECLAEVLDLSYYSALEDRAKEKVRAIEDSTRDAEGAISLRERELSGKPEYEAKLASVTATAERIGADVADRRRREDELREAVESLKARRIELDALSRRLAASLGEITDLERQARGREQRVNDYEAALQRESEIREQFGRLEETRAELERLERASFLSTKLEHEKAELKKEIAVQRERLSLEMAQLRDTIAHELEPRAKSLPQIEETLRATAQEQARLDEAENMLRRGRDEAQDLSSRVHHLEQANASLKSDMEQTRNKFDMLDQVDAYCPLCKQPLGPEGQDHLRREYEAAGREAKALFQRQETEQNTLSLRLDGLRPQIGQQQADLDRRRREVQARFATQERELAESQRAQREWKPALTQLEDLRSRLRDSAFALDEQQRLTALDGELSSLGYDGEEHQRMREQVRALEPFSELRRKLLEALEALPREREALETARQMLVRRRKERELDEQRREELERDLRSVPGLESQLTEAQSRHQALVRQQNDALVQQAVVAEQLKGLAIMEAELHDLKKQFRRLMDEKSLYDELAVAFGQNGIQALIIETAIPQLQNDANELLARLTEGRLSLKLQLQEGRKERRLGLPSEELQVLIADEVGTRRYETFSGGETFRIDFSLRIALSKLLARRSGAPLPILFIDEGFGSQDSAGQERLKEAIQSIQSDFQKIIVITHVEEVKQSFPTRIEVTKTGYGSTFVVV